MNPGFLPDSGIQRGMTLIEIIVSIALFSLMLAAIGPVAHVFETQNNTQVAALVYVQALRRAQTLSEAVRNDSGWGVVFATSSIVIFRGATYATRNSAYDESYPLSTIISASGLTEVGFTKFSGTTTPGTTTISTPGGIASKVITVNAKGVVSY